MYPVAPPRKTKKDAGLPAITKEEVEARLRLLPPNTLTRVQGMLEQVAQEDFWRRDRFVQVVRLLDVKDEYGVTQEDIRVVLDVSKGLVSRYKKYHRYNPVESRPRSGQKACSMKFSHGSNSSLTGKTARGRL